MQNAFELALKNTRELQLLGYTNAVLSWDMETYMPPGAAAERGELMEVLSKLSHRQKTSSAFRDAVLSLDPARAESAEDAAQMRKLRLDTLQSLAVTEDFVGAMTKAQVAAQSKWLVARPKKDFALVRDELAAVVRFNQEYAERLRSYKPLAEYYGGRSNYEILLDFFEPGYPAAELRSVLTSLMDGTKAILPQILERSAGSLAAMSGSGPTTSTSPFAMDVAQQTALGKTVAAALGFDFARGRLDTSAHPFCTNLHGEVRITTRYRADDFTDALSSVIHETGHAIYEQNLPKRLALTPCGGAASSGVHESQSRFYENFIGRSAPFAQYLSGLCGVRADVLLAKLNRVGRSHIRVDADEVTYNLHIFLRMLIEEDLISGRLEVRDLPERWNRDFATLLGIPVPDDAMGCLQDVHWYWGSFGYFPTYSLGNLLAAELFEKMKLALPKWESQVAAGSFADIASFLRTSVHEQAQLHTSPDTIKNILGRPLNADALLRHFRHRYLGQ